MIIAGDGRGLGLDYCCHFEFSKSKNEYLDTCMIALQKLFFCTVTIVIEGRVKRHQHLYFDHNPKLLVQVTNVDYDDIHHIKVDDIVEVKVSRLHEPIWFKYTYKLAGRRECGSNKLTIDETGLLTTLLNFDGEICVPYIEAGNCNDPRWEHKHFNNYTEVKN